jgi:hypothetical protein
MKLRVSELWIHPVKSLAGLRVREAEVVARGLAHDRRFMLVRPSGVFASQRELPLMALFGTSLDGHRLTVRGPDDATLELPLEGLGGTTRTVRVWEDTLDAEDQGDGAARFFSKRLAAELRLVRMPDDARRPADPEHARPGDLVSFADGFPFLLVTEASLAAFATRFGAPPDVRRFRPNLVVSGAAPFAEDAWSAFRVGPVTFHVQKPCARCQIVNVDPDTGVPHKSALATLAELRRVGSSVMFGQNLVHDGAGVIREGDAVELIG